MDRPVDRPVDRPSAKTKKPKPAPLEKQSRQPAGLDSDLQKFLDAVSEKCGADIVFNQWQRDAIQEKQIRQFGLSNTIAGFNGWYVTLDDFTIKQGAKTWAEGGDQVIRGMVNARQQAQEREKLAEELTRKARQEILEDIEARKNAEEDESAKEDPNDF